MRMVNTNTLKYDFNSVTPTLSTFRVHLLPEILPNLASPTQLMFRLPWLFLFQLLYPRPLDLSLPLFTFCLPFIANIFKVLPNPYFLFC